MKKNIVYILGAGCSAFKDGYPLAKDFLGALNEYLLALGQRPNCERLKRCLADTAALMEKFRAPTIDRLVLRIQEESARQQQALFKDVGSSDSTTISKLEQTEREQILDAKNATVAMFLEREDNARRTGLPGYRDFLSIIFDGTRSQSVLKSPFTSILSFNYDRLFDTAFSDYFNLTQDMDIYGKAWLNSGLDFLQKQTYDIAPDGFCFLKLHGTAAMRVAEQHGEARYGTASLHKPIPTIDDNYFWPKTQKQPSITKDYPEPLIVFPHEKDRAREQRTSFVYDKYIRAIWDHAAKVVQDAEQIWVIGYSFDPNDRKSVLELLRKSVDCEIVVQNPNAAEICAELKLRYHDLRPRLKPLSNSF